MAQIQPEKVIHATIRWEENPQQVGGVMSRLASGFVVFPSLVGRSPEGQGRVRESIPSVGETEDCVLHLSPKGTTYFAFPYAYDVDFHHGACFVPAEDPEITLFLRSDSDVVAWPEGDSTIIRVTPRK